ncbi:MAG: polysaccharide biosynthesis/export family protein [Bdellovibrionota bacterium]
MNRKHYTILLIIIFCFSFGLSGCARRSLIKPRSEIIANAESNGIKMRSIEEDLAIFEKLQSKNRERLLALVRSRSTGEFRDKTYRVGSEDEIEFAVFDVPELNLATKVRQSGHISLPLIGAVEVKGKTEDEIQEAVSNRLSTFVKNPQVSVFITNYGSQKVAVMGAVREPGTYSLKKGSNSVVELIGEAGGLSEKAGSYLNFVPAEISGIEASTVAESRAMLSLASHEIGTRNVSGIEIPMDSVLATSGGIPLEIPVRGGDMIVVPEAGTVQVDGEVEKRGTFELGQRMTLLGALAAAGGIRSSAKADEVEVIRQLDGDKVHVVINLEGLSQGEVKDVNLRSGDIIRVPSDSGKRMSEDTFNTITSIISVGVGASVPVN